MENKETELKNNDEVAEEKPEWTSFSYVDEDGNFHETIGYFETDPEGKTIDERIIEMQEIIKNTK